ncbi:hypothetical protein [Anaerosolibacter sp.]|uniref:hypothetical protein n=1 Tax=Anaerosolibacter sp. TaxID=1872527 RepID=UPI0039EEB2F1
MNKKEKSIDIKAIIEQAVQEGIAAGTRVGYAARKQEIKNCFKQTEKMLYAYNDLKDNIENYKEEIEELKRYGLPEKSKSIVYMPSGSRLGSQDLLDAKIQDLNFKIQASEREVYKIDKALEGISNDVWFRLIELKYFQQKNDDEIAEILNCDPSTIRRNKKRLINRISVRLHGADALS